MDRVRYACMRLTRDAKAQARLPVLERGIAELSRIRRNRCAKR